ncbi:hypothetical protein Pcinc_022762 [Petrolisthes cinctipes]|uniref:FIP-RBD domain-containing protein n=1 Tax=Petrolisthes cinctipes TaxID=88211 RepID=A0AAE1FFN8_PETCI|nr:hypothetical protein Pcinc_022762 [Petrolisthes cinctipes]
MEEGKMGIEEEGGGGGGGSEDKCEGREREYEGTLLERKHDARGGEFVVYEGEFNVVRENGREHEGGQEKGKFVVEGKYEYEEEGERGGVEEDKDEVVIDQQQQQQQQQQQCLKDPMRDSLMSNSDQSDFSDDEDDEDNDGTTVHDGGSLADNSINELEFDLWQGQFEITKPPPPVSPRYGHSLYREIVKTVQMLQQQVGVLAENQHNSDDRFSRVKQDNAAYQERLMMLEEQLREAEVRHEERQAEEQRRNRELIARIEREKQLTVENYTIKLTSVEKEKNTAEEESRRSKSQLEKLQKEKESLEDRVSEAEFTASALHQENAKLAELARREKEEIKVERERSAQVIEELRCEIERLRTAEETARKRAPSVDPQNPNTSELQATIKTLREENKNLLEQVEDLQAQLLTSRLEEGRTLVTATNNNSLAAEFEAMTSEEGALYGSENMEKLKKNLKDAQEANQHLRAYIDGILLNIVENYPQLLEVKQK